MRLADNTPTFNYNPLYAAARDILLFNKSSEDVMEGLRRTIHRRNVLQNFLDVVPLLHSHFSAVNPSFVTDTSPLTFRVGRDLRIPFVPPMIYGFEGKIYVPCFIFWKKKALSQKQLALLFAIAKHLFAQEPDLEEAIFQVLDFGAPKTGAPRELLVVDPSSVPDMSEVEMVAMLEIYAEAFSLAEQELVARVGKNKARDVHQYDHRQIDLFDPIH